jgi:RNA-directed DNA polymerase
VYREDILAKAWHEVKANAGSAGVDGQTIEQIEQKGVTEFLAELRAELCERRYRPQAVRRVRIPKPDGSQRGLGIPSVRDRVVQAAAKTVLEPIFEADFRDSSYGFRPKRSAHQAGEQLRQAVNRGANWIVEIDIEAFYDRIDHELLRKLVEKRVCDRRVLKLLRQWLKAGVLDDGELLPSDQGVPQGGVINQVVRGWGTYFRVGNSARKFQQVDDYVRERLALFLSKKSGQHGRRRERHTSTFLKGLGVYRLNGVVAWHTAAPTATR